MRDLWCCRKSDMWDLQCFGKFNMQDLPSANNSIDYIAVPPARQSALTRTRWFAIFDIGDWSITYFDVFPCRCFDKAPIEICDELDPLPFFLCFLVLKRYLQSSLTYDPGVCFWTSTYRWKDYSEHYPVERVQFSFDTFHGLEYGWKNLCSLVLFVQLELCFRRWQHWLHLRILPC